MSTSDPVMLQNLAKIDKYGENDSFRFGHFLSLWKQGFELTELRLTHLLIIGAGSTIGSLFNGGIALLLKKLVDFGLAGKMIWYVAAGLIIMMMARETVNWLTGRFSYSISLKSSIRLQQKLFRHLLSLPVRFFLNHSPGDLVARCMLDIHTMHNGLLQAPKILITSGATLCWTVGLSVYLAPTAALPILIVGIMLVIPSHFIAGSIRNKHIAVMRKRADVGSIMHEVFASIKAVKIFNGEDKETARLERASWAAAKASLKGFNLTQLQAFLTGTLIGIASVAACIIAIIAIKNNEISPGALAAIAVALTSLARSLQRVLRLYVDLQEYQAAAVRFFSVWNLRPEITPAEQALPDPGFVESIRFKDVAFAYPGNQGGRILFQDVSFDVKKGEIVALVGLSGSGKSTLFDLLLGFYKQESGEILINGQPLNTYNLSAWRRKIGVTPQDIYLFSGSVEQNIAYGVSDTGSGKLDEARTIAAMDEMVKRWPGRYDHVLSERAENISRGEAQRISLARAVARDPDVLLLDEATASLDSYSEKIVQDALFKLSENRLMLVIAHRLSTVWRADRIVVLDQGRIINIGTHEELIERCDLYRLFCELQFLPDIETYNKTGRQNS